MYRSVSFKFFKFHPARRQHIDSLIHFCLLSLPNVFIEGLRGRAENYHS